MSAIHIGISGWRYTPWRGDFYPNGLGHGRQPSDPQLIAPRQQPKPRLPRKVFCCFDNVIKVRAPFDARRLLERFHLDKNRATTPGEPAAQGVLS